jgi:hypothetical protein
VAPQHVVFLVLVLLVVVRAPAPRANWMGDDGSDSDTVPPPLAALAGRAGAGVFAGDAASPGRPSNLGKLGNAALADTDPLGVNTAVTLDEVGGLDKRE